LDNYMTLFFTDELTQFGFCLLGYYFLLQYKHKDDNMLKQKYSYLHKIFNV